MDQDKIIEITTIEQILEMSAAGAVAGGGKKEDKVVTREQKVENLIRKKIRSRLKEQYRIKKENEDIIRSVIRKILSEGDLSDTHPNRSTGINTLEDVLKKSIPTLRVDYKKLTTDKRQRDSFRSHIVKAVIDALKPQEVNASYLQGGATGEASALMAEPTGEEAGAELEGDETEEELETELAALEEAEIEVDVGGDDQKKIPVEDDDEPSPEEEFGTGLEDMDETGRNHAYTSYRKISQYVLDAYDSLANPQDKKVFLDYLVTNLKLYFDKFEDELKTTVEEPSTPEYDQAKAGA